MFVDSISRRLLLYSIGVRMLKLDKKWLENNGSTGLTYWCVFMRLESPTFCHTYLKLHGTASIRKKSKAFLIKSYFLFSTLCLNVFVYFLLKSIVHTGFISCFFFSSFLKMFSGLVKHYTDDFNYTFFFT